MITLEKGDLFAGDYNAISHGVNCRGVMGAGISRPFMQKYPDMYEDYRAKCASNNRRPGAYDRYLVDEDGKRVAVYNLFSQDNPGADATKDALFLSLLGASHDVVVNSQGEGRFIFAMPLIGCGIGGLEFSDLHDVLKMLDILFGEKIEYVVVYNDSNESQVVDFLP